MEERGENTTLFVGVAEGRFQNGMEGISTYPSRIRIKVAATTRGWERMRVRGLLAEYRNTSGGICLLGGREGLGGDGFGGARGGTADADEPEEHQ